MPAQHNILAAFCYFHTTLQTDNSHCSAINMNNVTKRRGATSQKRKEIESDEEWNRAALSIPCGEFEKGKEKEVLVADSQPEFYPDQSSLGMDSEASEEIESDSSSSESEKEKEPPKKKAKKVPNVKFVEEELPATDFPLKKRSVKEFRLQALRLFLTYPQCPLSPEEGWEELHKIVGDPEEYLVAQEDHKVKIWKLLS